MSGSPEPDLSVWSDHLEQVLREADTPREVLVYRSTTSTQDIARARAGRPVLVVANEQGAGRGRLGRRWIAGAGTSVLMSLTHRLDEARGESPDRVTFVAAVAVAEALERLGGGIRLEIKWPNDIMAQGRKLAGILVETVAAEGGRVAIVGIGINVTQSGEDFQQYPPELRERVTSLTALGFSRHRLEVAAAVARHLDALLAVREDEPMLEAWRARNLMSEQRVTLVSDGEPVTGTVVDLDPAQGLIVRRDSGEIVHLPAATTTVV